MYLKYIYDRSVATMHPYQELMRSIVSCLALKGDEVVFDLGTGTGNVIKALLEAGHHGPIIGIERSLSGVERAREKFAGIASVQIIHGDLDDPTTLAAIASKPEVVTDCNHLYESASPKKLLAQVYEYLSPGGLFLVNNPHTPRLDWVLEAHARWLADVATSEDRARHERDLWSYNVMITMNKEIALHAVEGRNHFWSPAELVAEKERVGFVLEYTDSATYADTSCLTLARKPY